MSRLFDLTITLNPSVDYRRLGLLLCAFALFGLFGYADPPWLMLTVVVIVVIRSMWQMIQMPKPHPDCSGFRYHQGQWILEDRDGASTSYESMQRCLDTGLFMLIRFSGTLRSRWMVIFHDQLSVAERRQLNVLAVIL